MRLAGVTDVRGTYDLSRIRAGTATEDLAPDGQGRHPTGRAVGRTAVEVHVLADLRRALGRGKEAVHDRRAARVGKHVDLVRTGLRQHLFDVRVESGDSQVVGRFIGVVFVGEDPAPREPVACEAQRIRLELLGGTGLAVHEDQRCRSLLRSSSGVGGCGSEACQADGHQYRSENPEHPACPVDKNVRHSLPPGNYRPHDRSDDTALSPSARRFRFSSCLRIMTRSPGGSTSLIGMAAAREL